VGCCGLIIKGQHVKFDRTKKNAQGFTDVKGLFRNNSWGIAEKFSVGDNGMWKLPVKYVKHFK